MDTTSLRLIIYEFINNELEKVIKSSYLRHFWVQYTFDVTFHSVLGCIPLLFPRVDRFFHFSLFLKIDGLFPRGWAVEPVFFCCGWGIFHVYCILVFWHLLKNMFRWVVTTLCAYLLILDLMLWTLRLYCVGNVHLLLWSWFVGLGIVLGTLEYEI